MNLTADIALSGRIDRIDEHHDGSLEIVDYKSGREYVTEEDVARSLALNVYQVLLKNHMPERRVFATLVALRSGMTASHELSTEDHTDLIEQCRETGAEILGKEWESVKPIPNDHCPHCDFLPYCTRYWKRYGLPMAPDSPPPPPV
jgi:RecB family exonuclease